jgi:hypothetical protein
VARTTTVTICDGKKEIVVKEALISTNEKLFTKWKKDLEKLPDTKDMADMFLIGTDFIKSRLSDVFTDIKKEDVSNSYQSEIEDLINAWIEVNFFGLKQMAGKVGTLVQLATKTASYQKK